MVVTKSILPAMDPSSWGPALDEAVNAVRRGALIVLPTDTVYGIGADAFDADAVAGLLAAKGRGRQMPPPVLVGSLQVLDALADGISDEARALAEAFWPGPLTLILMAQPSLAWDLGDTHGTVALRMPDHPAALALLGRTGPLAVSSANRTGQPAATTAAAAAEQLGSSVAVYLDGGDSPSGVASTIVDATGSVLRIVRSGGLSVEDLRAVVPSVHDEPPVRDHVDAAQDSSSEANGGDRAAHDEAGSGEASP